MTREEFTAQLNDAIPPAMQRALRLTIEDTQAGPHAVFEIGSETWQLTYATTRRHWQLHAPHTGVPLLFMREELLQSVLVLRTYRISQLDYAQRTTIQAQLTTALTLRGEDGQEIALSPKAALKLLDLLTVSEPELKQLVRRAGE